MPEATRVKTPQWRHIIGDIAWGDAAWMLGNELFSKFIKVGAKVNFALDFIWPLALAVLVLSKYYYDAVRQIKKDKGRPPSQAEMAVIKADTLALGIKVCATVAGWEVGTLLAREICEQLFKTSITAFAVHNPWAYLVAAAFIGLVAGISVVVIKCLHEWHRDNLNKDTAKNIAALFLATFWAGMAWYGVSLLSLGPIMKYVHVSLQATLKTLSKVGLAVFKAALIYVVVKFNVFEKLQVSTPEKAVTAFSPLKPKPPITRVYAPTYFKPAAIVGASKRDSKQTLALAKPIAPSNNGNNKNFQSLTPVAKQIG